MMKIINANVRKEKKDKILLTAVVNAGMADYTLNWIESLKRTHLEDKFLVFAIDTGLYDILVDHGYADHVVQIPEDWFHQKLSKDFAKWLDKSYTPITHAKSLVVERLLYADITVWFSDVDIVFTSPSIYSYLVMKLTSRKSITEFLTTQETEQKIINSGFYIMRPTDTNKRILSDSIIIQDNEPKVTQQRAMNRVIDEMNLSYQTSPIALLDLAMFPHGRMYFERKIPTKYGMEPMIVHANYRVGEEKKKSLQGAGLWYLDE
ncbi:nucleotide-diphospho-sugar transferase-domain-containing protein [Zychaea mexicana]|uniref:nucleotide-diphospho-sugar transferase-domain-containing protein n=1 Tax=Zychaea mexicana TaxID=64656 RepID=UPI0022FE5CF7|nr:nucleotide-diphospho-sugar transferase-domain-containing protein [Zychaea mexicana]KAI9491635.1 nucleotide-diphospho-sugar transferase-domain-containing protein [Zychaea mexicana]